MQSPNIKRFSCFCVHCIILANTDTRRIRFIAFTKRPSCHNVSLVPQDCRSGCRNVAYIIRLFANDKLELPHCTLRTQTSPIYVAFLSLKRKTTKLNLRYLLKSVLALLAFYQYVSISNENSVECTHVYKMTEDISALIFCISLSFPPQNPCYMSGLSSIIKNEIMRIL